ncbi:RNA recognition motif XS domain protein [Perilla frutescens var. hirtella]|uniref:RNA recognition motif XS domain protein n=1 Tax=Perilla frutescens var. hirtella TaxID=608512 RepID=A0AAD4P0F1_PERFH|nr:RNA recognition motif XS domain protein [Perilla frutescens var. hirtella]
MPGGSAPKPPHHHSHSAATHHHKSRWESSSSAAAAPKSKPSPHPAATPPNNKDSVNRPLPTQPNQRPENPSPRPGNPNSIAGPSSIFPLNDPTPPPSYGFHMLDRRSIVLADGSVRSYFALPPDYENFAHMHRPRFRPGFVGQNEFGLDRPPFPMSPDFRGPDARARNADYRNVAPENSLKRKFGEDERGVRDDGFQRQRQQLLQYGNANGPGVSVGYDLGRGGEMRAAKNMRYNEGSSSKLRHSEVDQNALRKAFLHFVKLVFETANQRKNFLADGKQGHLPCLACARSSKDFPDTHSLIMHAYNSESADSLVDHLAFHKALCILMGWNYLMPPNNSKAYQNLSAGDAEANVDDLIIWPPTVLIHNTITGKGRDGRMEGLGNRAMDSILRDLGFTSGKSMSLYAREGHLGMHTVKFSSDESGLKEARKLADYFERQKHGRKDWVHLQPLTVGKDDEKNPNLVKLDPKTGDKKRVFYGHLATVTDLDKITFELKKKVSIVSAREFAQPQ